MSEFDQLLKSVADRSVATQKSYTTQYKKLRKLLENDVADTSQKTILKIINEEINNLNGKQALINIAILTRRLKKLNVKELEAEREKNKGGISSFNKEKNQTLKEELPSYEDLVDYMQMLYEKSKWTDYIINYLLINFNVRNKDLLFDIVRRKHLTKSDKTKNYIWLADAKVEYIRNDYKTAEQYGQKVNVIRDKKFMTAVRRVFACQKYNEDCGVFIPNEESLGYYIRRATLGSIGEAKYNKIIINHYRNDIDELQRIAKDRGTSLTTLLAYYDIQNKFA